jgi:hypothetical protein
VWLLAMIIPGDYPKRSGLQHVSWEAVQQILGESSGGNVKLERSLSPKDRSLLA